MSQQSIDCAVEAYRTWRIYQIALNRPVRQPLEVWQKSTDYTLAMLRLGRALNEPLNTTE